MHASNKRWAWLVIGLCGWLLLAGPVAAQGLNLTLLDPTGATTAAAPAPVTVAAQFVVPAPGKPGVLQITATIEEGWHIYSITQPKGGPLATKISVAPNAAFELAGDFAANPAPETHVDNEVFKGVQLEEHRKQVTWSVPIKLAAGTNPAELKITGKVTAQACSDIDKNCLPPKPHDFTASFKPTANDGFREEISKAVLRGHLEPASVAPGGKAKLILSAEPIEGFHVYALEAKPTAASAGYKATLIALTKTSGFTTSKPSVSAAPLEKKDPDTGKTKYVHKDPTTWTIDITVPADAKPGDYTIAGLLGYQTCDAKSCLPARGASFLGTLTVGDAAAGSMPLTFSPAKYGEVELAFQTKQIDLAALPSMIGFGLLGGLILNLMPCVLPVIGLKVLSFVEQAGQSRGRVFVLNLWYSLGLLSVFVILATLAVVFNLSWGQQFQSSVFVICMACVVFAMALSFLGVWEIPLPGFVGTGAANELSQKEGAAGAFFKGMLTTILATPCSGPYLSSVFFYALQQPPVVTYAIFTSIGLGMASPYLLIGAFPKLIRFLPKPGVWMDTFKQVMAFVLLATVVFVLKSLKHEYLLPAVGLMFAIWAGCWWAGRTPIYEGAKRLTFAWLQGVAVACLTGFAAFYFTHVPAADGSNSKAIAHKNIPWEAFSTEKLRALNESGKTVMVDFTAEWCQTCKYNLAFSIDVEEVKDVVVANGVVPLLADWTHESDEIKNTLIGLGSSSIPILAIYPPDKLSEPIIIRDLISSRAAVIDALKQAGPSRASAGTSTASAAIQSKSMN